MAVAGVRSALAGSSGNHTRKHAPPLGELVTSTRPLSPRAQAFTENSPIPLPSALVLSSDSKRVARRSSGIPRPASCTSMTA